MAVTTVIGVGVAVTTTTGAGVGVGVAVAAGQTQVYSLGHSGFLQRFTPPTDAQINPEEHPESLSHDASHTPGAEGGLVGVGVSV